MGKQIMIVEDDKHIALALKIRLQAEGHGVAVAGDKESAVREAGIKPPDIALIDYNLPDGTGFDVMGHFSSNESTSSVVKILMPASKQTGLRDKALMAGAADYLEKPFKAADLLARINTLPASTA